MTKRDLKDEEFFKKKYLSVFLWMLNFKDLSVWLKVKFTSSNEVLKDIIN